MSGVWDSNWFEPACLSVIIAVTTAMIGVAIKKPDMGHALTVGVDIPLVKGLGPVMNIVLAYGTSSAAPLFLHAHD
jgi:hypothetical protein